MQYALLMRANKPETAVQSSALFLLDYLSCTYLVEAHIVYPLTANEKSQSVSSPFHQAIRTINYITNTNIMYYQLHVTETTTTIIRDYGCGSLMIKIWVPSNKHLLYPHKKRVGKCTMHVSMYRVSQLTRADQCW